MAIELWIGAGNQSRYSSDGMDYSVRLHHGEGSIDGVITLYYDHDGRMTPGTAPIDGWVSDDLRRWLLRQPRDIYRSVVTALRDLQSGEVAR